MGCTGLVGADRGRSGTGAGFVDGRRRRHGLPGGIGGLVGMIIVYKERRGGLSGLRGWVYIHPAPFDSTCPCPPAPKVPRSSSRSLPPDVHHTITSRALMIGGGGVIKVRRLISVKLD